MENSLSVFTSGFSIHVFVEKFSLEKAKYHPNEKQTFQLSAPQTIHGQLENTHTWPVSPDQVKVTWVTGHCTARVS